MRCPFCQNEDTKVIDSRELAESVRRRRECVTCGQRFTTYERAEPSLFVIKKDRRREEFDSRKLFEGLRKACVKRPVATEDLEKVVKDIQGELLKLGKVEVGSEIIGELAMNHLRALDEVAYVRFASVYREFKDVDSLIEEIEGYREWKRKSEILKHQLTLMSLD